MKPKPCKRPSRLMLLALPVLLAACGTLPTQLPASADRVPPLPPEARQPPAPVFCLPSCLQKWSEQAETWRQRLTGEDSQGKPAPVLGSR